MRSLFIELKNDTLKGNSWEFLTVTVLLKENKMSVRKIKD